MFTYSMHLFTGVSAGSERVGLYHCRTANCIACGQDLPFPSGVDPRESFSCDKCGQALRAHLRVRAIFLGICMICSLLISVVLLIVNPRVNVKKNAKLASVLELGMTRMLWRTGCVRIEAGEPNRGGDNPEHVR